MSEVRQRDLLPLPLLSDGGGCLRKTSVLSRRCQQRVCRRRAVEQRTNDAVCAVNELYACKGARMEGVASEAQSSVLTEMKAVVADTGSPPPLHEQEALRELLHQDARYNDDVAVGAGSLAAFGSAEVSLPSDASASPEVASLLPKEKAHVFMGFREHMLLSEAERLEKLEREGEPAIYFDPVLKRSRRRYVEFIRRLQSSGLICFRLHADEHCGIFFVRKKSGELRFICDARRTNARFREPPGVALPSGEALGRRQCPEGSRLFVGQAWTSRTTFTRSSFQRTCVVSLHCPVSRPVRLG